MVGKKDLAMAAIAYGSVYVARIAMGASPQQALRAFREAEEYPGTSIIISYAHCIAHGISMEHGLRQQKLAVESGYWPLLRFNPLLKDVGQNPMILDSAAVKSRCRTTPTTRRATAFSPVRIQSARPSCSSSRSRRRRTLGQLRDAGHQLRRRSLEPASGSFGKLIDHRSRRSPATECVVGSEGRGCCAQGGAGSSPSLRPPLRIIVAKSLPPGVFPCITVV
jgi:hypothetical protein